MSAKPAKRNWNDVQTAIATAAIVTTLGMWNLFAAPSKTVTAQTQEPTQPPPTDPPASPEPAALPYVKVIFTPMATQITNNVPSQTQQQPVKQKRKKRDNNDSGGGGGGPAASAPAAAPVAQTKSS
jgi:hypothetical protein